MAIMGGPLGQESDGGDGGLPGRDFGFVGVDSGFVFEGQADIVEAVEEAVFSEGVYLERDLGAVGADDDLAFQIDSEAGVAAH